MTAKKGRLARIRDSFHQKLCSEILGFRIKKDGTKSDVISVADKSSNPSRLIAKEMALSLGYDLCEEPPVGQSSGKIFGDLVEDYLRETFSYLDHVRPGDWTFSAAQTDISRFEQYDHLDALLQLARRNPELRTALDGDYLVKPDIIVYKKPLNDDFLNLREEL